MSQQRYFPRLLLLELLVILVALIFLSPFYFVLVNSVKPFGEILRNAAAWPKDFTLKNYTRAWHEVKFPIVLMNSILVTVFSIAGMVLFGSMAAWRTRPCWRSLCSPSQGNGRDVRALFR